MEGSRLEDLDLNPRDVVAHIGSHGKTIHTISTITKDADGEFTFLNDKGTVLSSTNRCWELISRATPEPKTWGQTTDEEKGALLLHAFKGGVVQYYSASLEKWLDCGQHIIANFADSIDYRAKPKPEPVVGEVVLHGTLWGGKPQFNPWQNGDGDTHLMVLPMRDGQPIPDTYTSAAGNTVTIKDLTND